MIDGGLWPCSGSCSHLEPEVPSTTVSYGWNMYVGRIVNLFGARSACVRLILAFSDTCDQVPLNRLLLLVTLDSSVSYIDGAKERVHTG